MKEKMSKCLPGGPSSPVGPDGPLRPGGPGGPGGPDGQRMHIVGTFKEVMTAKKKKHSGSINGEKLHQKSGRPIVRKIVEDAESFRFSSLGASPEIAAN